MQDKPLPAVRVRTMIIIVLQGVSSGHKAWAFASNHTLFSASFLWRSSTRPNWWILHATTDKPTPDQRTKL